MKKQKGFDNLSQKDAKRKKRRKILLTVSVCAVVLPLVIFALGIGIFAAWAQTVPLDKALLPTATAVPVFYAADGSKIDYNSDDYLAPEDIPQDLKNAFVALEDKRFYSHKGYDVKRMIKASLNNIKSGKIKEGGSTITQQLVKNTHLSQERTFERKLKELAIAAKLEKEYEKDEILAMYLSVIYFGSGAYGVKQASRLYFAKDVSELDLAECATLAGIVKNPSKYSPKRNETESLNRRNLVLNVMLDQNYIDSAQYKSAANMPLVKNHIADVAVNVSTASGTLNKAECEAYIKNVCKEVCKALNITQYQLNNSGLEIYTNLVPSVQKELYLRAHGKDTYKDDGTDSVSVVLDNSKSRVCAYYSTLPYEISRQAGSTLKPLAVYAPAIDKRLISLASPIVDERVDFNGFSPKNFNDVYYGLTSPRDAIKKSMNSVAVKVMDYVGVDASAEYLSKFGIDVDATDKNYALALGATANGVAPLKLANAYACIANGGVYREASFVNYVVDSGTKILSNQNGGYERKAVDKTTSSLLTSALKDTAKDGTAKSLSVLPFEVAAKTGTVEKSDNINSDAWNVSYNKDYTVLVWHGNDSGISEKGGGHPTRHAATIWKKLNYEFELAQKFDECEDIVQAEIDTYSTRLNKKVTLATENTPAEYRKAEWFASDDLPSSDESRFERIDEVNFEIAHSNGTVTLAFEPLEIYRYTVYRTDATGERIIADYRGCEVENITDEQGMIKLTDCPISLSGQVEYRLECALLNNPQIMSVSKKLVYVSQKQYYDNIAL